MARKKVVLKLKRDAYGKVSDALESGLQFAMNRLEDRGVRIPETTRDSALPAMLNELMIELDAVIDWESSN